MQGFNNISLVNVEMDLQENYRNFFYPQYPSKQYILNEHSISKICEDADIIVGDPIYKKILYKHKSKKFIPIPHIASSARIYIDQEYDYIGEAGACYFDKYLNANCIQIFK